MRYLAIALLLLALAVQGAVASSGQAIPVLVSKTAPEYPAIALEARVQGTVILDVTIDADGALSVAKVRKGLPLGLTDAALDAVEDFEFQWLGKPTDSQTLQIEIRFELAQYGVVTVKPAGQPGFERLTRSG